MASSMNYIRTLNAETGVIINSLQVHTPFLQSDIGCTGNFFLRGSRNPLVNALQISQITLVSSERQLLTLPLILHISLPRLIFPTTEYRVTQEPQMEYTISMELMLILWPTYSHQSLSMGQWRIMILTNTLLVVWFCNDLLLPRLGRWFTGHLAPTVTFSTIPAL